MARRRSTAPKSSTSLRTSTRSSSSPLPISSPPESEEGITATKAEIDALFDGIRALDKSVAEATEKIIGIERVNTMIGVEKTIGTIEDLVAEPKVEQETDDKM